MRNVFNKVGIRIRGAYMSSRFTTASSMLLHWGERRLYVKTLKTENMNARRADAKSKFFHGV